jgi:hypothetical protein
MLSLQRLISNSSSTTNFPWLSPNENWLAHLHASAATAAAAATCNS